MNTFSIGSAVAFAWESLKLHRKVYALFGLAYAVLGLITAALPMVSYTEEAGFDLSAMAIIGTFVSMYIAIAAYCVAVRMALTLSRKQPLTVADLFTVRILVTSVAVCVAYYVLAILGFVLLIIPGIYFILTYGLVIYVLLDGERGALESGKEAARIVTGSRMRILGLLVVLTLLTMLASIIAGFIVGFILGIFGLSDTAFFMQALQVLTGLVTGAALLFYSVAYGYVYFVLKGELPSEAKPALDSAHA